MHKNVFVINLPKSVDRKNYVKQHFLEVGIKDYTIIEGIDGKTLSQDQRQAVYDEAPAYQTRGRGLIPGEIGCALSHLKCYKQLLSNNLKSAFIFEDDCQLNQDAVQVMENIVKQLDHINQPIITLLTLADYVQLRCKPFGLNKIFKHYRIKKVYKAGLAHGYYINHYAAKKMLETFKKINQPIDTWKKIKKLINILCVYPYCVRTNDFLAQRSTILSTRATNNLPQKNKSIFSRIAKQFRDKIMRPYLQQLAFYITGIKRQ